MAEWIYFIHPPREDFAATMTDEEKEVWSVHFERFERMLSRSPILVGPTLGDVNTGISIFEVPDEAAARRIMDEDPVIAAGFARVSCGRSACRCCGAATRSGPRATSPATSPRRPEPAAVGRRGPDFRDRRLTAYDAGLSGISSSISSRSGMPCSPTSAISGFNVRRASSTAPEAVSRKPRRW